MRVPCGIYAEMTHQTFGQALGELILQKRRTLGLTQTQLAEDAFGTAGKTRRISELETGTVANPHPKTIDPILSVLKITDDEIEACAKRAARQPDVDLDRAYREARNLIEAIARRFEHDRPEASLAELDNFLRGKAEEWSALRDRISALDTSDSTLSGRLAKAGQALADGRFEVVDAILAAAEEQFQNDRTLTEIRKQADIRIARGDASLLSGAPNTALIHYQTAAEYFRPFDQKEMVQLLQELAFRVYETSKRSLSPNYQVASTLLTKALSLEVVQNDKKLQSELNYRLGLIIRNDWIFKDRKSKKDLDLAISHATEAVRLRASSDSFHRYSAVIGLSNLMIDRATTFKGSKKSDITEAIEMLESLSAALRADESAGELRAHACNSLGAAFLTARDIKAIGKKLALESAMKSFQEAVDVSEKYSDPENWGVAKSNIGSVLAELSRATNLAPHERSFLRMRAISEFQAASETVPFVLYPLHAAMLQEFLGRILAEQGRDTSEELREMYLIRAIQAFETVGIMLPKSKHPKRWAISREWIGGIYATHAQLEGVSTFQHDVEKAAAYFEEAAATYEHIDLKEDLSRIRRKIESLSDLKSDEAVNK